MIFFCLENIYYEFIYTLYEAFDSFLRAVIRNIQNVVTKKKSGNVPEFWVLTGSNANK